MVILVNLVFHSFTNLPPPLGMRKLRGFADELGYSIENPSEKQDRNKEPYIQAALFQMSIHLLSNQILIMVFNIYFANTYDGLSFDI